MPGASGRYLAPGTRMGQWHRTHKQCNPDPGRSELHHMALHRTGQAHA
jgi:hypothetical protein